MQCAFPDTDHSPTLLPEFTRHQAIPLPVPVQFCGPPIGSSLWQRGVPGFGAAVPKAAIDENHHSLAAKHEIGFAQQSDAASPPGNGVSAKQGNHPKFCVFVAA